MLWEYRGRTGRAISGWWSERRQLDMANGFVASLSSIILDENCVIPTWTILTQCTQWLTIIQCNNGFSNHRLHWKQVDRSRYCNYERRYDGKVLTILRSSQINNQQCLQRDEDLCYNSWVGAWYKYQGNIGSAILNKVNQSLDWEVLWK